jgi:hypothetical protein
MEEDTHRVTPSWCSMTPTKDCRSKSRSRPLKQIPELTTVRSALAIALVCRMFMYRIVTQLGNISGIVNALMMYAFEFNLTFRLGLD